MSQTKPISLGFTSNPGRAPQAGSARLINCYAEVSGKEQKAEVQVWAADGLDVWSADADSQGTRGMIDVDGTIISVRGRRIYSTNPSGATIDIGGIPSDAPVTFARNRRPVPQIGIVSQDGQYVVVEANSATNYSSIIRSGANSVEFLNGYFVFTHDDGSISHTFDDQATTIDPLAFSTAASSPDPAIRGIRRQSEVVIFGTRSTEFYADVGGDPFAFQRNQAIEIGCAASASAATVDQTIAWIADDMTVRMLNGYQGQRISNHAVERSIAAEPRISEIVAVTWRKHGHTFYCISGSSFSWVFDVTTQFWHNRESYGQQRWRASCIVESNGDLVVGVYDGASLYKMNNTAFAEGSSPLVCKIITPPVHATPNRVRINALYLDMIPGVGRNTFAPANFLTWGATALTWGSTLLAWGLIGAESEGEGNYANYEPEVVLRWSLDGGQTWSAERKAKIGRMGQTLQRIVFRRIGTTRQAGITFEISCSAAVMRGFMGASVDADKLAA